MKRTIIIISILILAALISFVWLGAERQILLKSYPLEFEEYVEKYAEKYAVPQSVIYGVIKVESNFKSDAVSKKGAIGLMQITPETFEWLCMSEPYENASADLLYNPEINIHYGTLFLSLLYSEFGTWDNAFAAYNAGRTRVNGWLADERYSENGRLTDIPFPETADYVVKVAEARDAYTELYFSQNG